MQTETQTGFAVDRRSKTFFIISQNNLDILTVTLGYESYNFATIKLGKDIIGFKVWSAGHREIISSVDLRNRVFYSHLGKINYMGQNFKILRDGVLLVKVEHVTPSSYLIREVKDISRYITEENNKYTWIDLELPTEPVKETVTTTVDVQQELISKMQEVGLDISKYSHLLNIGDNSKLLNDEPKVEIERKVQPKTEVTNMTNSLGSNVPYEVKDGKLIMVIDLSADFGLSKTGKSNMVASTHGFSRLPAPYNNISVGLNVIRKD